MVLIGEIRDAETAQIAVEAALTGHLVLTTLHTNDAPSAVNRLVEMGVEPVPRRLRDGQRRGPAAVPSTVLEVQAGVPADRAGAARRRIPVGARASRCPTLLPPGGCASCSRTGYRGRMALHEVMVINEEIERLTVARSSTDEVARAAVAAGMVPLRQDGWLKVLPGTPRSRKSSASSSEPPTARYAGRLALVMSADMSRPLSAGADTGVTEPLQEDHPCSKVHCSGHRPRP